MKQPVKKDEIVQLEEKYWDAMKSSDVEGAISLTHFPCIINGPDGTRKVTKEEYRSMMEGHPMSAFKDVKILNPMVEILNDSTAIITYSTKINGMEMTDTSTWIKEKDQWVCAFHSENPHSEIKH